MQTSMDCLVKIMALMYGLRAEVVVTPGRCVLYLGNKRKPINLNNEDVEILIYNNIIEHDSGCNEEGYEEEVYVLTDDSQERIKAILDNRQKLLLKS